MGPDVLVGLFLERSVETVVGIIAILKAGGAYLPIDPVYPKDRVAFMLEDANVPVILTEAKLQIELPKQAARARVICIDTDLSLIDAQSTENVIPTATPDSLAYIIYTSGSTGKPKGTAGNSLQRLPVDACYAPLVQVQRQRTFGHSSTLMRSTSAYGRFGARYCTADA